MTAPTVDLLTSLSALLCGSERRCDHLYVLLESDSMVWLSFARMHITIHVSFSKQFFATIVAPIVHRKENVAVRAHMMRRAVARTRKVFLRAVE